MSKCLIESDLNKQKAYLGDEDNYDAVLALLWGEALYEGVERLDEVA